MTLRVLFIAAINVALLLSGCESQEQPAAKTAPHQVVKPDKPIKTKAPAKNAEATKEEVVEPVEKTVRGTEQKTEEVVPGVAIPQRSEKLSSPEEVVFNASYGNVTLTHAMHANAYDCSTCHGEATPAAMTLGKNAAHTLCKGCHKDEDAGPTGCKDCHVK